MPITNSSLTGVTLSVTSGNPPAPVGTQVIPLSGASVGANSVQITDSNIVAALSSGNTINHSLQLNYANGLSVVSTAGTPYVPPPPPPPPPTTPTQTNLLARYDASIASSYTLSRGNVTQWNDLTGNGYHLLPNGTGPTTTTINSIPAFNFNYGRGFYAIEVPLAAQVTIFMVAKYSTLIGYWGNFMHHGDRNFDWSLERQTFSDFTHNIQFQSSDDNTFAQRIPMENDKNYIFVGRIVGTGSTATRQLWAYSDTLSTQYVTGTGVSITPGVKTLYVGKSEIGERSNSTIGEILYYYASLSDADVNQNVAYLQNKWFS